MSFKCHIRADSVNEKYVRLTTMEITYPRLIHCEFMTHRVLSRNAASSRAIPVAKMLQRVEDHPFIPIWWGRNQAGMQAPEELRPDEIAAAKSDWLAARDSALQHARSLAAKGVHKQIVNRILEPWAWITVIVTATDWDNFFALRCHPDAQPEFRKIAEMMFQAYNIAPAPRKLKDGEWHLPYVTEAERVDVPLDALLKVATGRCARVSYLNHDGRRDLEADITLHDKLAAQVPGHWSPFEHCAQAKSTISRSRNFRGFMQYRAMMDLHSVQE